jgi:hypothetical protein
MTAALREAAHWSSASHDTGWRDTPTNRAAVRAAAAAIDWTDRPAAVRRLQQPPVRVLFAAIFFGRLDQLRTVEGEHPRRRGAREDHRDGVHRLGPDHPPRGGGDHGRVSGRAAGATSSSIFGKNPSIPLGRRAATPGVRRPRRERPHRGPWCSATSWLGRPPPAESGASRNTSTRP